MKTLVVYHKDSYYKFDDLYKRHVFELGACSILKVFEVDKITGEDRMVACFKEWCYFLIDEQV